MYFVLKRLQTNTNFYGTGYYILYPVIPGNDALSANCDEGIFQRYLYVRTYIVYSCSLKDYVQLFGAALFHRLKSLMSEASPSSGRNCAIIL